MCEVRKKNFVHVLLACFVVIWACFVEKPAVSDSGEEKNSLKIVHLYVTYTGLYLCSL